MYFSGCFCWLLQKPFTCWCCLCCLFTPFSVLIPGLLSLVFKHRLFKPDFELGYFFFLVSTGRSTASVSPVFPALLLSQELWSPSAKSCDATARAVFPMPCLSNVCGSTIFRRDKDDTAISPIITISVLWCCSTCTVLTRCSQNNL